MPKKRWEIPQLIVVSRGEPEESVLIQCKTPNNAGPLGSGCGWTTTPCSGTTAS